MNNSQINHQFTQPLLDWYDINGRKHLPWKINPAPYPIWISEIMLQQTQVQTVIPYFQKFIVTFANITSLAMASEDEVLALWSGLGYYSRARNIHKTAKIITQNYNGEFPKAFDTLLSLPGIGPSTAAAIASLAYNQPIAILDGNVKRVLSRYFLISGLPEQASVHKKLWELAQTCMSKTRCADYTQAIMDLGATCCTNQKPSCNICPLNASCLAYQHDQVARFPQKKERKIKPTKEAYFFILHTSEKQIYLEKNPSKGIWGGLWCTPQTPVLEAPADYFKDYLNLKTVEPYQHLLTYKHAFTHFNLIINAITIKVHPFNHSAAGQWFYQHELSHLGLPKPIDYLLTVFFKQT